MRWLNCRLLIAALARLAHSHTCPRTNHTPLNRHATPHRVTPAARSRRHFKSDAAATRPMIKCNVAPHQLFLRAGLRTAICAAHWIGPRRRSLRASLRAIRSRSVSDHLVTARTETCMLLALGMQCSSSHFILYPVRSCDLCHCIRWQSLASRPPHKKFCYG